VIKDLVLVRNFRRRIWHSRIHDAYDANTAKRKWRFYTVPEPGQPGSDTWEGESWKIGGSPAWVTGTYDVATNTTFWTTGIPLLESRKDAPEIICIRTRCSALDPDTGKLKWHFQFTQHDEHDYDATQVPGWSMIRIRS